MSDPTFTQGRHNKPMEPAVPALTRAHRGSSARRYADGVEIGQTDQKLPMQVEYPVRVVSELAMPKPIEVKPLANYRIWLRYDDGVEGEVDLSDLAGRGVFEAWNDSAFFRSVRVASRGAVEWNAELDLCPDALYMRLTGKSPEELFPALRSLHTNA